MHMCQRLRLLNVAASALVGFLCSPACDAAVPGSALKVSAHNPRQMTALVQGGP